MKHFPKHVALVSIASALAACATAPVTAPVPAAPAITQLPAVLVMARPEEVGFAADLNARIDSVITAALNDGEAPGAAVAVGRHGRLVHLKAYGKLARSPGAADVTVDAMYDMASLTKVVATTTLAMMLEDQGKLDLRRTVASYVPEFDSPEKANITVKMILTHSGGLEADVPHVVSYHNRQEVFDSINLRPLRYPPGNGMIYSDIDLIMVQTVIERITGRPLDSLAHDWIFASLGMTNTMFKPDTMQKDKIAATERDSTPGGRGLIWGTVHDPTAFVMGGVAGHAGLFSSARDVATFVQTLLNGGEYNGIRLVKATTVARWSTIQDPGSSRAIGWDTPSEMSSAGHYFSQRSFGHTGFTGTSIWVDPVKDLFVVLLTNRVNETSQNQKQAPLRRALADTVQQAITDAPLINWEEKRK
jgi:CubicO group peptidase (beta-lactamase class C family)